MYTEKTFDFDYDSDELYYGKLTSPQVLIPITSTDGVQQIVNGYISDTIYESINILDVMAIDKLINNWTSLYYDNRGILNTESLTTYFSELPNHNKAVSPVLYVRLSQIKDKAVHLPDEKDVPDEDDKNETWSWAVVNEIEYTWNLYSEDILYILSLIHI